MCKLAKLFSLFFMSSVLALSVNTYAETSASQRYVGIGRDATPAEVAAWDIDCLLYTSDAADE